MRRFREGDVPKLASPETGLLSAPPRVCGGRCNGPSAGLRMAACDDCFRRFSVLLPWRTAVMELRHAKSVVFSF